MTDSDPRVAVLKNQICARFTVLTPELEAIAELLAELWRDRPNAAVTIEDLLVQYVNAREQRKRAAMANNDANLEDYWSSGI